MSTQAMPYWHFLSMQNRTQEIFMVRTKRKVLLAIALSCIGASQAVAARAADAVESPALEDSVVKIFSTMRLPDPFKPWAKQAPSEATASEIGRASCRERV